MKRTRSMALLSVLSVGVCLAAFAAELPGMQTTLGAITRGPTDSKRIALCFTAHSFAEGAEDFLTVLARHKAKASFFFTGEFLSNTNFDGIARRVLSEGHYLGPHSDRHLLYCSWGPGRQTLVTRGQFLEDLTNNLAKIHRAQRRMTRSSPPRFFLPPYEHYNQQIADWTREAGMLLVNFTPGTRSNADYTGEAEKNFVPSQVIYESIVSKEKTDPHGLNGFILLLHLGSGPGRRDKFQTHFGQLCELLTRRGYQFVRIDELLLPR